MSKSDGGPAFPRVESDGRGGEFVAFGMTLRDYFAAKALEGHIAAFNILDRANDNEACNLAFINAAAFAYRCADAMLAERAKSTG